MKNIIPLSSFLSTHGVGYHREANMGIEVAYNDVCRYDVVDEFIDMMSESDMRTMGSLDSKNGELFIRVWVAGKVPDWDFIFDILNYRKS